MEKVIYLKAKLSYIWGSRKVTKSQSIFIGSTSLLFNIVIFYFGICRPVLPNTYRDSIYYSRQCLEFSRFTPSLWCDEKVHLGILLLLSLHLWFIKVLWTVHETRTRRKAAPLGLVYRVLKHGSGSRLHESSSSQVAEHHYFVAVLLLEPLLFSRCHGFIYNIPLPKDI